MESWSFESTSMFRGKKGRVTLSGKLITPDGNIGITHATQEQAMLLQGAPLVPDLVNVISKCSFNFGKIEGILMGDRTDAEKLDEISKISTEAAMLLYKSDGE